jgi:uncharacterized membrane protein
MHGWSFEIVRQSGWDLWVCVCAAAAIVLLGFAAAAWSAGRGAVDRVMLGLAGAGVGGTAVVLATPALHNPAVGLVWTLALLCILSMAFYRNLRQRLSARRCGVLLGMRLVSLALLVPMLFEPIVRQASPPPPRRPLLVLVDTSGSMSFADVPNGPTRVAAAAAAIASAQEQINAAFDPHYFTFDSTARRLKNAAALQTAVANGPSTDLAGAVKAALAQDSEPGAAVVIFSDGIDNTSADVVASVRACGRAVSTVRVGSESAEPANIMNVAVDHIDGPDQLEVHHDSIITATIRSTALAERLVDVKLSELDAAGKAIGAVQSQSLVLQPTATGQTVKFTYRPAGVGVHKLAVWIDPLPGERNTADNRQEYQALAVDPRIRVLYVEGRARPEYRELNRALARDGNLELASLLRLQQDRFAAAGTVDGQSLKHLPRTAAEWEAVDVILLGDVDSSFLPIEQQQAMERRVNAGAGLLMIGGQNSLGPGGYADAPIGRLLPVMVGGRDSPQERSPFVPQLTDDGLAQPAMAGLGDWFPTAAAPARHPLPPLRGNVVVAGAKAGAQVLLVHPDRAGPDGKPQIVLAVQRYGQGRTAAFTADTTYLWYLPLRELGQDSPYNRFWGQLIRWLANSEVRSRERGPGIDLLMSKSIFQLGESARVRALVRDQRGDATGYAQVKLTMTAAGGKPEQLALAPAESQIGLYEQVLPSLARGDYTLTAVASKDGKELGRAATQFTVIPPADEMLKLAAEPQTLAAVAEATHGFHVDLGEFPNLLDQLTAASPHAPAGPARTLPLFDVVRLAAAALGGNPTWPARFDLPLQGCLVITCLLAEWALRRHWQLS